MIFLVSDIFSKDIETEAGKIIKRAQSGHTTDAAETMTISIDHKYPSRMSHNFLVVQHYTSMYPERLTTEMLLSLLEELIECFTYNVLPLRNILISVNQLIILVIARKWDIVTQGVLDKLVHFFKCENFQDTNQVSIVFMTVNSSLFSKLTINCNYICR